VTVLTGSARGAAGRRWGGCDGRTDAADRRSGTAADRRVAGVDRIMLYVL